MASYDQADNLILDNLSSDDITLDDVEPLETSSYASPAVPTTEANTFTTPELPSFDLAQPDAIAAPYVAPTYEAPEPYVPDENATVAGQMNKLTDENSAYMQQATRAGERSAQAKGLLNSSMAGTAGQSAALASALPIATADANTYATAGLAGYQGKISAALQSMDAESQHNLTVLNGQISSDLAYQQAISQDYIQQRTTTLQGMISSQLSAQEAEATLAAMEYQGLISAGLSEQEAQQKMTQIQAESASALALDAQQQQGANYRALIEENLALQELSAEDRANVSTAMTNYGLQLQKDISAIQSSSSSGTYKSAKIKQAQKVYEANLDHLATLYPISLSWSSGSTSTNIDTNAAESDVPLTFGQKLMDSFTRAQENQ